MTELARPPAAGRGGEAAAFDGFLRADAGRLVDARNQPVHLRGVGLGNWLLAEGYMWKFTSPHLQSPRQIEAFVLDLVGSERASRFWSKFRDRFITEADIAQVAAEGMNHVRLPINSRDLIDDDGALAPAGFAPIDRLIDWCRAHGLWVVLDLHGAPGGQTGTNIDDSPNGTPELFHDTRYRLLTLRLWRALAERYREETVVAGYDLLNEPLPNEYQHLYADELVSLYRDLSSTIREVDPDHLLIYEGAHWATNWSIFSEVWDPNSMLSFHKYWSPPDRQSIEGFLQVAGKLGLPIYMGEGGENSVGWLHTAFQLYDDHGISWNFWPWKKLDTHSSPCSVNAPPRWLDVLAYGNGNGPRPHADDAWDGLVELLDALAFERCTYRPEIVSALLRTAPLRIPAAGFGFRGSGRSYHTSGAEPLPAFRSDDLVTVRPREGADPAELSYEFVDGDPRDPISELFVVLSAGDWVAYEVNVRYPMGLLVGVTLDPSSEHEPDSGPVALSFDGGRLETTRNGRVVSATVGLVGEGDHVIRVECIAADARFRLIDIGRLAPGRA